MGFPKDFKIPVLELQMYRQMGKSAAVPVIKEIAKEITTTLLQAKLIKAQKQSA
jgi:DNA (cytosine-5)-methyltransferase 1